MNLTHISISIFPKRPAPRSSIDIIQESHAILSETAESVEINEGWVKRSDIGKVESIYPQPTTYILGYYGYCFEGSEGELLQGIKQAIRGDVEKLYKQAVEMKKVIEKL